MPSSSEIAAPAAYDVRALALAVLMPSFAGTTAPPWVTDAIAEGLGGICYFGHNIESPQQVAELSTQLHAAGSVLISIDEEGGIVTRLHARLGSPHVGAAVLGRVPDTATTAEVAGLIAAEIRAAGVDIDLAPVGDVNSNPANPVIGVRSFGDDPATVAEHVRAFVGGLQSYGVAACVKHFPGHGDTMVDSHVGVPAVDVDHATLQVRELVPFASAIDAGVRCVMTAHAVYSAIDDQPATISPVVLSILRDDLGFDGVIISDAIDMQAISGTVGFAEGAVRALIAGVDLVGLGNPVLGKQSLGKEGHGDGEEEFIAALGAIVGAVDEGRLSAEALQRSAARIQALRDWRAREHGPMPSGSASADDDAARAALRVRGSVVVPGPLHVVDVRRQRNIASGRLSSLLADEIMARVPGSTVASAFVRDAAAEGRVVAADSNQASVGRLGRADVIVTGAPAVDPVEAAALAALLDLHPKAVVVCLGWSAGEDDIPSARNAVFAFGDSLPTARAVADLICR